MRLTLSVLAAMLLVANPVLAEGDPVNGKLVFKKCQACHTVDAGNRVGPSLQDVVGRPVASLEGFRYSTAMTSYGSDGKVWDVTSLSGFLLSPRFTVKGTSMIFPGIKQQSDIDDLIAYLQDPGRAP